VPTQFAWLGILLKSVARSEQAAHSTALSG
jgi:hypothetical protein